MANHEKVFGVCENKCFIEVSPKEDTDAIGTRVGALEGIDAGTRLDTLESEMDTVQDKNISQDNRLTAVESKNTEQDTAIAGKADASALANYEPKMPTGTEGQVWTAGSDGAGMWADGATLTAGNGVKIENGVISIDDTLIPIGGKFAMRGDNICVDINSTNRRRIDCSGTFYQYDQPYGYRVEDTSGSYADDYVSVTVYDISSNADRDTKSGSSYAPGPTPDSINFNNIRIGDITNTLNKTITLNFIGYVSSNIFSLNPLNYSNVLNYLKIHFNVTIKPFSKTPILNSIEMPNFHNSPDDFIFYDGKNISVVAHSVSVTYGS